MSDKRLTMREAVSTYVRDGQTLALEGFTSSIPGN
jgi:acyl CoA:acetate/3-ketoacid CoA transferase alpha subunit